MRLFLRSLAGITPVFLALSLAIGALELYLERRENIWALEEEGLSTAIAIAGFADSQQLVRYADQELDTSEREQLLRPLKRILASKRIDRIVAFTPTDRRVLLDIGRMARHEDRETLVPDDLVEPLFEDSPPGARIISLADESEVLYSVAPIRDRRDKIAAVLAVQLDASSISRRLDLRLKSNIVGVSVALGLGLCCALLIAGVIAARIRNCKRAVDRTAEGDYEFDHGFDGGLITEFNALDNTLETMIAALRAAVGNVRRGVVDSDQFRTEQDLAVALEDSYLSPVQLADAEHQLVATAVGPQGRGVFFHVVEQPERSLCVFGSVSREGVLEPALEASATVRYFSKRARVTEPEEIVQELAQTFSIERLRLVSLDRRSGRVREVASTDGTPVLVSESAVPADRLLVYHDLPPELGRRLELFLTAIPRTGKPDLVDELQVIVNAYSGSSTGVLAVIGRAG